MTPDGEKPMVGSRSSLRCLLYARSSAVDPAGALAERLALVRAAAAERGWTVAGEHRDQLRNHLVGRRPGLQALTAALRKGGVDVVICISLPNLFRDLRCLVRFGCALADGGVDILALDGPVGDGMLLRGRLLKPFVAGEAGARPSGSVAVELASGPFDTTDPSTRLAWRQLLELGLAFDRARHSEAVQLGRLAARGRATWGRATKAVNPLELAGHWHGRADHRPLSHREIAKRIGVSPSTVNAHVRELLTAGTLNPELRAAHLAAHGGLRKGGRPTAHGKRG